MRLECSKRVRRILRKLASTAYERELCKLLEKLDGSFARWRNGEIGTGDLVDQVDEFAKGSARRHLYQQYRTETYIHLNVAQAIVRGLLTSEEVPADVLDVLENAMAFYRQGLANGTVSFDEED